MPSATPESSPPRIVLGVAGGIAAYKSIELLRLLRDADYFVAPILTADATRFVGAVTFSALASEPARTKLFGDPTTPIPHTYLGQSADLIVVAPATAHLIRLERSIGRAIFQLDKPTVTYLHGACTGSGIELAAFTDWVVAASDTQIALPEIGLGLVPGAGGTVSLTRRIGRLRTAWLAFSGSTIDAATARTWGLVDELEA